MAHFFFRSLVLAGLFFVLAACQASRTPTPTQPDENQRTPTLPAAASATLALTQTPGELSSGLTGQVFAESDVAGQANQPLPGQIILVIPDERAKAILGAGGNEVTDENLRFLRVNLPQKDPAVMVTQSDEGGQYRVELEPGAYVLCLADSEGDPPNFPVTTRGCGRTQVTAGEMRQVDISSGFGEILLVEP